tara:strand:- start:1513 stop:1659 length:147 start_codon:yes stop_codon:yes gene_type:complete
MEITLEDKEERKAEQIGFAICTMAKEQTYGIRYHEFLKELSDGTNKGK